MDGAEDSIVGRVMGLVTGVVFGGLWFLVVWYLSYWLLGPGRRGSEGILSSGGILVVAALAFVASMLHAVWTNLAKDSTEELRSSSGDAWREGGEKNWGFGLVLILPLMSAGAILSALGIRGE